MAVYDIGDTKRLGCTFYDATPLVADPTTVSLRIRKPDDTVTTYTYAAGTVTRASTGSYYRDVAIDQQGNWFYDWIATGTIALVEESGFYVRVRLA